MRLIAVTTALFLALGLFPRIAQADVPADPAQAAARMDALLAEELLPRLSTPPAPADDETFLRRLGLDFLGELPTAEELTAFCLDDSPDKRFRAVERVLADPRFGVNWGRYWRDVLLARRTDQRAQITSLPVVDYLAGQFNGEGHWDEIAGGFVTARGLLDQDGRTALIASQWGEGVDVAAETSRILLGIQIQCAQCHDHHTDRWKREEFHHFAAYFPRVRVRREGKGPGPQFVVTSLDRAPRRPRPDGAGDVEHYMPDLDDPAAKGTLMQPVMFLTGAKLPLGTSDAERRAALAEAIASNKNEWFSLAFVNRVWCELTGRGFYEPVDDLGPDRPCLAPRALDYLATEFEQHRFEIKWLYRTIALTAAYQQAVPLGVCAPRPSANVASATDSAGSTSSPAPDVPAAPPGCRQRLRADQLFNILSTTLELTNSAEQRVAKKANPRILARSPRMQFDLLFGYDPSLPQDELSGSIPQALALMNGELLQQMISARPGTVLYRILEENPKDDDAVAELYLRCLGREPTADELRAAVDYCQQVSPRGEAFEDLLWVLLNSTEFLHRD